MPFRRRRYGARYGGCKRRRTFSRFRRTVRRKKPMRSAPLPRAFKSHMLYNEIVTTAGSASGSIPGVYVFSANGIYDPNITGTGHQPRGFDQIMPLFENWTVIGSKIRAKVHTLSSTATNIVGITLMNTATALTDINDYMENPRTVKAILPSANINGDPEATLSMTFDNKFFGKNDPLDDPDLQGTSASNPPNQAYFHLWSNELSETVDISCRWLVDISYVSVFTTPVQPAAS